MDERLPREGGAVRDYRHAMARDAVSWHGRLAHGLKTTGGPPVPRRRLASLRKVLGLGFMLLGLAPLLCGCASAVSAGQNAALDGTDLVNMTDQMAASIAADPEVREAVREHGKLVVVVQPVVNMMTAEVLPRGPAEAFTGRVRSLLANHDPDSFTWVMNRDAYYRLRNSERDYDLGQNPDRVQPEYALTAKFSSLTKETKDRRSSYYLCVYELTNLHNAKVLWTDKFEVKKTAVGGGILD